MGTPEFAVPALKRLAEITNLRLVVTQPDRRAGRGRKMEPPAVKKCAADLGVDVIQPAVVKGKRFSGSIAQYKPDVIVTAAFGRILGASLLDLPRFGCLNVHASLLPKYRGAAPINWAIIDGNRSAGVSIMKMDTGLDTGPVYKVVSTPIGPMETTGELTGRLAVIGADAIRDVINTIGEIEPVAQDHAEATHARILKKSDGQIDWAKDARDLQCHIRGMHPWPCAHTVFRSAPMKVHSSLVFSDTSGDVPAGTVVAHTAEGLNVACGQGVLRLVSVQLPGKKRLDGAQFYAGVKVQPGETLG